MDGTRGEEDVNPHVLRSLKSFPGPVDIFDAAAGQTTDRGLIAECVGNLPHRVKVPGEAIGNPASITSTPSSTRAFATSSFSGVVMLQPGDCSPSRRVVSKMVMELLMADLSEPRRQSGGK